jgi:putative Ca2+/H+ antiporter (TMEM165/GDT1 family)
MKPGLNNNENLSLRRRPVPEHAQLLAMALGCRFRWQIFMLGVFAATLCNYFLAVVAGTYLTKVIPLL